MHEVQASLLFCAVLRAMRHEGYSFDVNVFDENCICTDPDDPWAGNNAIPAAAVRRPRCVSRAPSRAGGSCATNPANALCS